MSDGGKNREIDFTFCLKCKHWTVSESDEPCHECLSTPVREYSHIPMHFEEDPNARKKNGALYIGSSQRKHGS